MKTVGIMWVVTELDLKEGSGRKWVYRQAKAGKIPDSLAPAGSQGGQGKGWRFKMTVAFRQWIEDKKHTNVANDFNKIERSIPTENYFPQWNKTLAAMVQFGKKATKKLRVIKTRYGFNNEMKKQMLKALLPIATFYYEIDNDLYTDKGRSKNEVFTNKL